MMKKAVTTLIIPLLLFIPGCWDIRDINSTAFAVSIGLDQPNKPNTANYKVTLEFAKPVPGKPMSESMIATAEGKSIHQAIQRIQTGISRTISFSHLRVLVIGEKIAKARDFRDLSNYLMKNPEVALRLRLVFVEGNEAKALLSVKPRYGQLLASELVAMAQLERQLSLVRTNHFFSFWFGLKTSKGTAFSSRALIKGGGKTFVREGAGIYKNWKLFAWLNADEAQAANWLVSKTRPVVVANEDGKNYTYQVTKVKTKIKPVIKSGKLMFLVETATNGVVTEETGEDLDFSKQKNIKKVEALFTRTVKEQVRLGIEKSQHQLKVDYLGFGKALQKDQPKTFKSLDWAKVYPTVPITVKVKCKVSSSGLQT